MPLDNFQNLFIYFFLKWRGNLTRDRDSNYDPNLATSLISLLLLLLCCLFVDESFVSWDVTIGHP